MSSRLKNLRVLKSAVNKEHGKGTLGFAGNVVMDMPRLSTGSLAFDFALGGGIPVGRTTIFWGSESSGKTTAAYRTAAESQNLCANCLRPVADLKVVEDIDEETGEVEYVAEATCDCYKAGLFVPRPYPEEMNQQGGLKTVETIDERSGKKKKLGLYDLRLQGYEENSFEEFRVALLDIEGAFDHIWAKKLGLDMRRVVYVRPDTAEEGIDIYESLMLTGSVDMLIVDSLAVMTPSAEVEASTMDWQQGLQARLINKMNRLAQSALNVVAKERGRVPTQLWINQERIDIQKKFGKKEKLPGGKAQMFSASVIVNMWASKWEKATADSDLKKDFQMEVGKEVRMNFHVEKNKTAPARVTGNYVLRLAGREAGRIVEGPYVLAQAQKYGLVRKESASKWMLGDEEFKSKSALLARMEDPRVFRALKRGILERMLKAQSEE